MEAQRNGIWARRIHKILGRFREAKIKSGGKTNSVPLFHTGFRGVNRIDDAVIFLSGSKVPSSSLIFVRNIRPISGISIYRIKELFSVSRAEIINRIDRIQGEPEDELQGKEKKSKDADRAKEIGFLFLDGFPEIVAKYHL